jgi:phosphoribosylglycinamide formyltransferase-1
MTQNTGAALSIVVLVSGRGSNLQALIDAERGGHLAGHIRAVVSNRPEAYALERARRAAIPAQVVDHTTFIERADFERALINCMDVYQPGLVAMAGWMRVLSPDTIAHYENRILNIHPSLLPAFRGLNTHRRALAAGVPYHGCSVHLVTGDLDAGPVVIQAKVKIEPNDDPDVLAARVLQREHIVYPMAVRWFCEGRLKFAAGTAYLDGALLKKPVMFAEGMQ